MLAHIDGVAILRLLKQNNCICTYTTHEGEVLNVVYKNDPDGEHSYLETDEELASEISADPEGYDRAREVLREKGVPLPKMFSIKTESMDEFAGFGNYFFDQPCFMVAENKFRLKQEDAELVCYVNDRKVIQKDSVKDFSESLEKMIQLYKTLPIRKEKES